MIYDTRSTSNILALLTQPLALWCLQTTWCLKNTSCSFQHLNTDRAIDYRHWII